MLLILHYTFIDTKGNHVFRANNDYKDTKQQVEVLSSFTIENKLRSLLFLHNKRWVHTSGELKTVPEIPSRV